MNLAGDGPLVLPGALARGRRRGLALLAQADVDRDLERGGGRVGVLLGLVLVLRLDKPGAAVAGAPAGGVAALEQAARRSGCLHPHEGSEVSMAGSHSTDLRERVLAAVEAGAAPEAAARRFAVGRSTAYRWAREARTEGRRAAKRMGGGPKPRIAGEVEAALLGLLAEANHLTLAECRDRLAARTGVRVHPWTVGRALRRCGWT